LTVCVLKIIRQHVILLFVTISAASVPTLIIFAFFDGILIWDTYCIENNQIGEMHSYGWLH